LSRAHLGYATHSADEHRARIFAAAHRMKEQRSYFRLAGHCTRCHEPFDANATAFMASESVIRPGNGGLTRLETVPVCAACVTDNEQADATLARRCKGCGLAMRVQRRLLRRRYEITCSDRCAQRGRRLRRREKKRMCTTCGTEFKTTRAHAECCSGACRQKKYRAAMSA
jgi:hypothetical protein